MDVSGGQPDNPASSSPDFDRWILPDNLCDSGYGMRIIVAVRLSSQRNMVIRCEEVKAIERHGPDFFTVN